MVNINSILLGYIYIYVYIYILKDYQLINVPYNLYDINMYNANIS